MNYRLIAKFHSFLLALEALFMLPALLISIADRTHAVTKAYCLSMLGIIVAAGVLFLLSRKAEKKFYARDGFVCVASGWILLSLGGCLPLYLSGEFPHFIDALFEIVSGFTTTGASVLSDVESLSRAILYWRSFSHWLGGMGVLVFLLVIFPSDGKQGFTMHLFRAESPGPDVGKLVPKLRQTASVLYGTYVVLTVVMFMFLLAGGMPVFDSVCTAFGTAGTGGFGIKNDSMGSYSPYLQDVVTVFMLLFGVNFSCFYLLLLRQFRSVIRDEELRFYGVLVAVSILLIFVNVSGLYETVWEGLRHSAFSVASIVSTTGFSTVDFDQWPVFSKGILTILMVTGACAGSTCGGMKCARVLLLLKSLKRSISGLLHPNRVEVIRVNERPVDEKILTNTNAYLFAYLMILVVSFFLVSLDAYANSLTTSFTAVLSCFNNIGPGMDAVGPTQNFGSFSVFSKLILIFDMFAGRLEIFPILVLFSGVPLPNRHRKK